MIFLASQSRGLCCPRVFQTPPLDSVEFLCLTAGKLAHSEGNDSGRRFRKRIEMMEFV